VELRLDFLPTKSESSFERLGVPSVETRTAQKRLPSDFQLAPRLHRLATPNINDVEMAFNDDEVLLDRALRWEPLVQARTTKRLKCPVAMPSHSAVKRPAFDSD
jgi:hypothetical protein